MNAFRLIAVAAMSSMAIATQTVHADPTLTRAQVRAELAKANDQVSFGELEYPPSIIESDATSPRTQGQASPSPAEVAGLMIPAEEDFPPVASRPLGQVDSHTFGIVVNLNGNRLWNL